jgi:hypothetical protein
MFGRRHEISGETRQRPKELAGVIALIVPRNRF